MIKIINWQTFVLNSVNLQKIEPTQNTITDYSIGEILKVFSSG